MTIDEIRQLIDLVVNTGVAELEVQRGENRVKVRRGEVVQEYVTPVAAPAPRPAAAPAPAPAAAPVAAPAEAASDLILVKSPIVGTFYESPSPGSAPFVRIGEAIQPGKVLCIIESMKLMNEIEAEVSGVLESKLVKNGQPVEYGEALFAIRPV